MEVSFFWMCIQPHSYIIEKKPQLDFSFIETLAKLQKQYLLSNVKPQNNDGWLFNSFLRVLTLDFDKVRMTQNIIIVKGGSGRILRRRFSKWYKKGCSRLERYQFKSGRHCWFTSKKQSNRQNKNHEVEQYYCLFVGCWIDGGRWILFAIQFGWPRYNHGFGIWIAGCWSWIGSLDRAQNRRLDCSEYFVYDNW